jgi:hypothetical protein
LTVVRPTWSFVSLQDVHRLDWRHPKERFAVPISMYNKSDLVPFVAFALLLEVFDTIYWTTLAETNSLGGKKSPG